jgi:hypothetical protein
VAADLGTTSAPEERKKRIYTPKQAATAGLARDPASCWQFDAVGSLSRKGTANSDSCRRRCEIRSSSAAASELRVLVLTKTHASASCRTSSWFATMLNSTYKNAPLTENELESSATVAEMGCSPVDGGASSFLRCVRSRQLPPHRPLPDLPEPKIVRAAKHRRCRNPLPSAVFDHGRRSLLRSLFADGFTWRRQTRGSLGIRDGWMCLATLLDTVGIGYRILLRDRRCRNDPHTKGGELVAAQGAEKVMVRQWRCGAKPLSRVLVGPHPRSAMLVLIHVSSMKTRRRGSMRACHDRQCRRRRATSERVC